METKSIEQQEKEKKSLRSVFVALFAALISVGAFIAIPVGPSPIVRQNMLAVLSGALLGAAQGGGAVGLFLAAGALGLPVFSGGRGGIAHLLGPTGGFLAGYFISVLVTGFFLGKPSSQQKTPLLKIIAGCALGYLVMYIPGVLRLKQVTDISFTAALSAGMLPFLPGDLIKLAVTVPLAAKLRPVVARYIFD